MDPAHLHAGAGVSYQIEVTVGGRKRAATLSHIKVGATPGNLLLRFADENDTDALLVEMALPVAGAVAMRFAQSVSQAVATQPLPVPPAGGRG